MPRDLLEHPQDFGHHGNVVWIQPTNPAEYTSMRAAELQHHFVLELTERLQRLGQPKSWLEERSGMTTGRLSKLLRGHAQLTLRDVAAFEGVLGPVLTGLSFRPQVVRDPDLQSRFGHGQ